MNANKEQSLEILNRQVKELAGIYHRAAVDSGVSDNEFWVWYTLLVMGGDHSQQDICDIWSLPKQTVNSAVANMVKKNYVSLEVVPGTRNRKIIRLTEDGQKYGEAIIRHIYGAEQRTVAGMSEEEQQACITLLGKYIRLLKEEFDEKTAAECCRERGIKNIEL